MKIRLQKLHAKQGMPVQYCLAGGEHPIHLNPLIGKPFHLTFTGNIFCKNCNTKIKKNYGEGFCFICMRKLACCDFCILKPSRCHFAQGTCREPEWAQQHCMQSHIIYLAKTSGFKVGLTRGSQIPTRWLDQGALEALPIFKVSTRQHAGFIEDEIALTIPDKTNWRGMLKNERDLLPLSAFYDTHLPEILNAAERMAALHQLSFEPMHAEVQTFEYPVLQYPSKVNTYNLDKTPEIRDTLLGIRGQYLIFEQGVMNVRKFTSYEVEIL